jgi:hypothetical protein
MAVLAQADGLRRMLERAAISVTAPNDGDTERIPASYRAAEEAAEGVPHEIRVRVLLTKVPPTSSAARSRGPASPRTP